AEKESALTSRAVRQTPLTDIESPSCVPSVTVLAEMTILAPPACGSSERIVPSSSMIPVNMLRATDCYARRSILIKIIDHRKGGSEHPLVGSNLKPRLLIYYVGLDKFLVGFCQVHDAFDNPDDVRNDDQRSSDAAGNHRNDPGYDICTGHDGAFLVVAEDKFV